MNDDPIMLEQMVRSVEAINIATARMAEHFDKVEERIKATGESLKKVEHQFVIAENKLGSFKRAITTTFDEMGKHYTYFIKVEFLRGTEDALEKAKSRWKAYGEEVKRHLTEARGVLGGAGGALGLSGAKGIGSAASGAFSGVMGALPFGMGNVLGLILQSRKQLAEFSSYARTATAGLNQLGVGAKTAELVRSRIMAMNYAFGSTGKEIGAVIDEFREFGIGAEMFEKTRYNAGALGRDLVGVVTALEMTNNLSPGTIAKEIGEIFEAGGESRSALISDFMSLDSVAQKTHVNVGRLMSTMTQSASSLRVQRQGVSDLAEGYVKLFNALQRGSMRGAPEQAIGAAAMSGVQAASGGIGGLSEGLQAELSRRMGGPTGVAGIVGMQENLSGKGAGGVFAELGKMAKEITGGGSSEEQIYALEKVAPSLGFEGARAVIDMMSGGSTLKDVKEAIASPQDKILKAMQNQSAQESAWQKVQRQIMMHMAAIGGSILTVIMTGFDTLLKVFSSFASPLDRAKSEAADLSMTKFANVQDQQADVVLSEIGSIFKVLNNGLSGADKLPMPAFFTDIGEKHAQRAKAEKDRQTAASTQALGESNALGHLVQNMITNPGSLSGTERTQLMGKLSTAHKEYEPGSVEESDEHDLVVAKRYLESRGLPYLNVRGPQGWTITIVKDSGDKAETTK